MPVHVVFLPAAPGQLSTQRGRTVDAAVADVGESRGYTMQRVQGAHTERREISLRMHASLGRIRHMHATPDFAVELVRVHCHESGRRSLLTQLTKGSFTGRITSFQRRAGKQTKSREFARCKTQCATKVTTSLPRQKRNRNRANRFRLAFPDGVYREIHRSYNITRVRLRNYGHSRAANRPQGMTDQ